MYGVNSEGCLEEMVIPSSSEWREMAEWIGVAEWIGLTRSLASFVPADQMCKSSEERYVEAFKI